MAAARGAYFDRLAAELAEKRAAWEAGPGGELHALGDACDRALSVLCEAEAAVHAAPSLTIADVRRKLEAAELHFEPDDNDGVTINAAIDGLRSVTGADPFA